MAPPSTAPKLYTGDWKPVGDLLPIRETYPWPVNALGTAQIELVPDKALRDFIRREALAKRQLFVRAKHNGVEWVGRADTLRRTVRVDNGVRRTTMTLTAHDDWRVFERQLVWPAEQFPVESQVPPVRVRLGPAKPVLTDYLRATATRLGAPIRVLDPIDPDDSPFIFAAARMPTMATFLEQHLKDTDLVVRHWRAWPGKPDPRSGLTVTRPTIMVRVESPRDRRFVRFSESAIDEIDELVQFQTAHTVVLGGKSPEYIGKVVTDFFQLLAPALKNAFLAFLRHRDPERFAAQGAEGLAEVFASGGGDAFTLDALYAAIQALWDTRASETAAFKVRDALPWTFGTEAAVGQRSYLPGDLVTTPDGVAQQVSLVELVRDAAGAIPTPTVGHAPELEDPNAQVIRRLSQVMDRLNANSLFSTG